MGLISGLWLSVNFHLKRVFPKDNTFYFHIYQHLGPALRREGTMLLLSHDNAGGGGVDNRNIDNKAMSRLIRYAWDIE